MAVSPATDSAVRGFGAEAFLVGEIIAASLIVVSAGAGAAFVIVAFVTLMGASSALDIWTITRFIIPTTTRTLFMGVILDTKVAAVCSLCLCSPGLLVKCLGGSCLETALDLVRFDFNYPSE
jgi:hypothetical protein